MAWIADIVKYGMIAAGILVMVLSFWYHSVGKLTVNLAVVWEILGTMLLGIGIVPAFTYWTHHISVGTGLGLFFVGAACLWGGFQFSLQVSGLAIKNQELAMQVSLLMKENEEIMQQLEKIVDKVREDEEKNPVCD